MKPIIAVLPNVKDDGGIDLADAYIHAIEKAGGIPFIVPYTESGEAIYRYLKLCRGVLLTGGGDISPTLYGKASEGSIPRRDYFELNFLKAALEVDKPVMAICRGIQLVNVYFGGTLIEDIPSLIKSDISHNQSEGPFEFSHEVEVTRDSPLYALFGIERIRVNSFHHQAIDDIGEGLLPMAHTPDGIIEAVFAPSARYLRAYQWHPERLYKKCEYNLSIFKDFIKECEK